MKISDILYITILMQRKVKRMNNYNKWLEKEQEWIEQMARENKASAIKMGILCIPACAILLGLIGLISGGGISGTLQNMLWGAIFGVVAALFIPLLMPRPRKVYAKTLGKFTGSLTSEEQEALGSQMLSSDVRRMDFKSADKIKQKIMITKSFITSNTGKGFFVLIKLDDVEQIFTDVVDFSVTARSHGVTVHSYDEAYSIEFRYKKPTGVVSKDSDVSIIFPTRELRTQAMQYIQDFVSQRPEPPTILGA